MEQAAKHREEEPSNERILSVLKKTWGYQDFRPFQREAVQSVLQNQDSVVVLPTGGGKSLCFQVPALCLPGLSVVVSPLIALMKDQVDALRANGVKAQALHSQIDLAKKQEIAAEARSGELRLLYVSPERLLQPKMISFLKTLRLSFFAIDEAHCISSWGHDFRPEYRQLCCLKKEFPKVAVHAYTATATPQVQKDMIVQLGLDQPRILTGSFDRENLIYKVHWRQDLISQLTNVLHRFPTDSGIIYAITRKEVEEISEALAVKGYRAKPYHAGLLDEERRSHQEAFLKEDIQIIVATVAFGMGIDKSNVRFVIHAGVPKSLEHYQQESGRAGRDGLTAECHLLYSAKDFATWNRILDHSEMTEEVRRAAGRSLSIISSYASSVRCRHRVLVEHFGQEYKKPSCEACDVCLGELEPVPNSKMIAQKILSCVYRLKQSFGADYTAEVLKGSKAQRVVLFKHDRLSTWGLLEAEKKPTIRNWIELLVEQGYLQKKKDYQVLGLTEKAVQFLKETRLKKTTTDEPQLLRPIEAKRRKHIERRFAKEQWQDIDRELFERLRELRTNLAKSQHVPSYIIFSDVSLREMAARRPKTKKEFLKIKGVGEVKAEKFGEPFLEMIRGHKPI